MNNNASRSDFNSKVIELEKQEDILRQINKRINDVLNKMEIINEECDGLVDTKIEMRKLEIKRNRKYVTFATVMMMLASLLVILNGDILLAIFPNFFEYMIHIYPRVENILILLVLGSELFSFVKIVCDEEHLCRKLVKSEEYRCLMEQIKDKEREMKYLEIEYEALIAGREELEVEMDCLRKKIFLGTGKVKIENKDQTIKPSESQILSDDGKQNDWIVDTKRDNGHVRKRNMRNEMKNNRKKGEF